MAGSFLVSCCIRSVLAVASIFGLFAGFSASAERPQEDLSVGSLSFWARALPRCVDIGDNRTICTWAATDDEYFTCIVAGDTQVIRDEYCVFETIANRDHEFIGNTSTFKYGSPGQKRRAVESQAAIAWAKVNENSDLLRLSRAVGHGPMKCMSTDVLICEWETDNSSPGHQDTARYLATKEVDRQYKNNQVRVLCEFHSDTLKRTRRDCKASFF